MDKSINQYITFLKEYKKLLERGVKDVLSKSISSNFIWVDDIEVLLESKICTTNLNEIFTNNFTKQAIIFSLEKPFKPDITIPSNFISCIEFDEARNKFYSINNDENELTNFQNSDIGKQYIAKIKSFEKCKKIHNKLFNAYDDLLNDTNLEIVLSLGLIRYSKKNNSNKISIINQHLFHFPLTLSIFNKNTIRISFSKSEIPYVDFSFLNNLPIIDSHRDNIISAFEREIEKFGNEYIYETKFVELIQNLESLSDNSSFENYLFKPKVELDKLDFFKVSFSPAINIKQKKPRNFEKLIDSIIEFQSQNECKSELFNLLIRNPENKYLNQNQKSNYFIDELFEKQKENATSLNAEEDFTVFFPLPYNNEQKQIYENYLKNRLTVVTGPPGTGKSHTIVNILCSLLAQGKRVLVTAQTDKALESLLQKIPKTFDDLIFTKIQLENREEDGSIRFSLEKSVSNLSSILTDNFYLNIESKIKELNTLKSDYVNLKTKIISALEKEYNLVFLNDTFNNLRAYQIVEKFEKKDSKEWNWIKDELTNLQLKDFDKLYDSILNYRNLLKHSTNFSSKIDFDLNEITDKIMNFDFMNFVNLKEEKNRISKILNVDEKLKEKFLSVDLAKIIETLNQFSNSDIVLKKFRDIENLLSEIKPIHIKENFETNLSFSNIIENEDKYLLDIETYKSFIKDEKVGFLTKQFDSKYKKVSYLEDITINGSKANSIQNITKLKEFIQSISIINKNFKRLQENGYVFNFDDKADLISKNETFNLILFKVKLNKEIVGEIKNNTNIINFSNFVKIDRFNVEELTDKAIADIENFEKLKDIELKYNSSHNILLEINKTLEKSKLKQNFNEFYPIQNISELETFNKLLNNLKSISNELLLENKFSSSENFIKSLLPSTFENINEVPIEYISKENFEFANANSYLIKNEFIDIQKTKEDISFINKKIYETKCDILFDLAKNNFRNNFINEEKQDFINLLKSYSLDYNNSLKKGIKDNAKFQISVRKKSIEISKKLSCWIMKFNDVLNSVGNEPEIFDCIIVDEASQLDFNSLLLGYYAKSIIVVGDDKQTSPNTSMIKNSSFDNKKRLHLEYLGEDLIQIRSDTSLFDLSKLVAGDSDLQLNEHFRCVPELIEFSKKHFYNNSLRALKQINGNRLNPKISVFVEKSFVENQIVSREIDSIYNYLKKILLDREYQNKTIGVVSLGLAKHTLKLKELKIKLLDEFSRAKLDSHKLIIEEPSKFQGDERDVMLVSLGVALDYRRLNNNENAKPNAIIDAQDEKKKINVALSRAKEQMILFHSVSINDLKDNDFRVNILNFFNEKFIDIKPLVLEQNNNARNQYNISQFVGYTKEKKFDSWFEYDIANNLIINGYNLIEPQYEVKSPEKYNNPRTGQDQYVNFKLDLVIHNNGKRVAIECDGDPFHSLPEDVAYDIERQEFLERVGWKVYRILYSAYKRNPSNEIEKLIDFINRNTMNDINTNQNIVNTDILPNFQSIQIEETDEEIEEKKNNESNFYEEEIITNNETEEFKTENLFQHKSYIDFLNEETIKESFFEELIDNNNNFFVTSIGAVYYNINDIPQNVTLIFETKIKDFQKGYLFLGYENGNLAKFLISTYAPTSRTRILIEHGVRIQGLKFIHYNENDIDIAILSKNGKCIVHNTSNINNPIRTRASLGEAKGVNILKLKGRDIVELFVLADNTKLSENSKEYFKKDSRAFGFYLRRNDEF